MKKLFVKLSVALTAATLTVTSLCALPASAAAKSNNVKAFSSAPKIDGKVSSDEWGDPIFTVKEGEENIKISKEEEDDVLEPFTADIYVGYDSTHIFVAAVAEYENHLNETIKPGDLWRGDCMQLQISAESGKGRNEFNFSNNSISGKSMVDAPYCAGKFTMVGGEGKDFIVVRDGNKTVYEMAISVDQFTKQYNELESGMILPFSVAFHQNGGAFIEYCDGIVQKKDISLAGQIVLGEGTTGNSDKNSKASENDESKIGDKQGNSNKTVTVVIIIAVAAVIIVVLLFVLFRKKEEPVAAEKETDNTNKEDK